MKVSLQQNFSNNYQPKFNGVKIVQVAKEAFANPNNLNEVTDVFSKNLEHAIAKPKSKLANFFIDHNLIENKAVTYLEQPYYVELNEGLKEMGGDSKNYNWSWLSRNIKTKLHNPLDANYHSFYVYTDDEKNGAEILLKGKPGEQLRRYYCSLFEKKKEAKEIPDNSLWSIARVNRAFSILLSRVNGNKPVEAVKINDLSELYGLF